MKIKINIINIAINSMLFGSSMVLGDYYWSAIWLLFGVVHTIIIIEKLKELK